MAELIISKLVGWGLSKGLAGGLLNLGTSLVLAAASAALNRPSGSDLSRDLAAPRSLPPYRHAYGRSVRIQGSWAPGWVVSGTGDTATLYGCIILNSRPSGGDNFAMFLDRRAVGLSGDITDFGTLNSGTATVLEAATTVVVTHGLGSAPVSALVKAWGPDGAPLAVSAIGATTFTVTVPTAAPSGGTAVSWRAGLATDGGIAQNSPFAGYVNVWLGTGAQQHPPLKILAEMGDLQGLNPAKFWPTDRWAGRTVLWVRFVKGASPAERWPSSPPLVEVQADWSRVWDPRDDDQDPDDADTWTVSDNQALCLLDALRQNPLARYSAAQLRLADFEDAADIADQLVPLRAGGAERRYRAGGLIAYSSGVELADALRPLELAGAGSLFRAGGKMGYAPGAWSAPEVTLTECLRDAPIEFRRTRPTRDLPGALKGVHPDPAANWERAETPPRQVDPAWDGGDGDIRGLDLDLVFSGTQAQRIIKIQAERAKLGKTLSATFPPAALRALAGGRVTVQFPRETDARRGTYRVTRSHPAQWLDTEAGVAMALPLDLEEDAASVYAWDADTDEAVIFNQGEAPPDATVPTATWIGATLDGGDLDYSATAPFELVSTDPNPIYEWRIDAVEARYRRNQEPFWLPLSDFTLFAVATGEVRGSITAVIDGSSYDIALRTRVGDRRSAWLVLYAQPVGITLAAPSGVSATAGAGQITVAATAPADADCAGVQVWIGLTSDPEVALLIEDIACDPSDPVSVTATGLPAGTLHRVFVRAVTASGAVGPWAATVTATPT